MIFASQRSTRHMTLVDAHLHLQDERFADDLDAVLQRARDVGVSRFISCGVHENDWPRLAEIVMQHGDVHAMYGLHPWHAAERSGDWIDRLEERLDGPCVGVGEIGLDAIRVKRVPRNVQEHVFREQWMMACRRELPIAVHCVCAWRRLDELLNSLPPSPRGFLLHGYGGSVELIDGLARHGAYFSFGGPVLDPRNDRIRAAAARVPPDRLLLESDAPDMAPREPYCPMELAHNGAPRNEPLIVPLGLGKVARLRNMPSDELSERLLLNAERLFAFSPRS